MSGVLNGLIDRAQGSEAALAPQIAPNFMPAGPETPYNSAALWPQTVTPSDAYNAAPVAERTSTRHPPRAEPHLIEQNPMLRPETQADQPAPPTPSEPAQAEPVEPRMPRAPIISSIPAPHRPAPSADSVPQSTPLRANPPATPAQDVRQNPVRAPAPVPQDDSASHTLHARAILRETPAPPATPARGVAKSPDAPTIHRPPDAPEVAPRAARAKPALAPILTAPLDQLTRDVRHADTPAPPPSISVQIDRVEINAAQQNVPARTPRPPRPRTQAPPKLTLEAYLAPHGGKAR